MVATNTYSGRRVRRSGGIDNLLAGEAVPPELEAVPPELEEPPPLLDELPPELEAGPSEPPSSVPPPGDVVATHPATTRPPHRNEDIERERRVMGIVLGRGKSLKGRRAGSRATVHDDRTGVRRCLSIPAAQRQGPILSSRSHRHLSRWA